MSPRHLPLLRFGFGKDAACAREAAAEKLDGLSPRMAFDQAPEGNFRRTPDARAAHVDEPRRERTSGNRDLFLAAANDLRRRALTRIWKRVFQLVDRDFNRGLAEHVELHALEVPRARRAAVNEQPHGLWGSAGRDGVELQPVASLRRQVR
jgi:hypothetical protein